MQEQNTSISPQDAGGEDAVLRVLCLGDAVGRPGRLVVRERLKGLRDSLRLDWVIVNGENAAGGIGLTPQTANELFATGVDCLTTGNHIWKHREIYPALAKDDSILRPYNYGDHVPGRGYAVYTLPCGFRLGVLNLLGRTFMEAVDNPFHAADAALRELEDAGAQAVIVDFHAEASSEKRAMVHFLDGRVAGVVGTHTHVQTSDARISALGTASITDLGMCGVEEDSVIGMGKEAVLKRFLSGMPQAFKPAKGELSLNGVVIEVDGRNGKALSISLLRDKPATVLDARGGQARH